MMKQRSNKGMWKRTVSLYFKFRVPILLYILEFVLGVVNTKVALLYVPYLSKMQLGNIEDTSAAWSYLGLATLSAAVGFLAAVPTFYASSLVSKRLQGKLLGHAVRLPMRVVEENGSEMVSWIIQDSTYANGLISAVVGFITGIVSTVMTMNSLSGLSVYVGYLWYLLIFIVAYILFSTWFSGKMMFLRQRRESRARAELTAYLAEHLSFYMQIKQLHSRAEESKRGKSAIETFYKADIYQALLTLYNNFVSGSLTNIISLLIFIIGVPMVRDGRMTMEELVTFQNLILMAYQQLSGMPQIYVDFMYYNGQLFYISSLMYEKEELITRGKSIDENNARGDIVFEDVSFSYCEDGEPVIANASFTIPQGKLTVIVGENGSGKTTLFKLLERFYTPSRGRILFGGEPAEDIDLDSWRKNIAYVLQEPRLFNATVRENIAYGFDGQPSDSEITAAAKTAFADEFISRLPGGYDYEIGDNGSKLSGGQRQRLAIARAVLTEPNYLLLDEATCNLDAASELAVNNALLSLMEGRTTVMITHDMRLLERADNVVVLGGGGVEAAGTFEEAAEKSQTLRRLIEASRETKTA